MDKLLFPFVGVQGAAAFGKRSLTRAGAEAIGYQAEVDAQHEELGGIQREADRKDRLAYALSSQIAEAGAKGVSIFSGSPLKILEADIEAEETATERDEFQTQLAAMTTRTKGKLSKSLMKKGADIQFFGDLTSTGFQGIQAASALGGKKA